MFHILVGASNNQWINQINGLNLGSMNCQMDIQYDVSLDNELRKNQLCLEMVVCVDASACGLNKWEWKLCNDKSVIFLFNFLRQGNMAAILQTTFSIIFWLIFFFQFKFHQIWSPRIQLTLYSVLTTFWAILYLWPLLLTWFNFNPSMDK